MMNLSSNTRTWIFVFIFYFLAIDSLTAQNHADFGEDNLGIGLSYSYGFEVFSVSEEEFGVVNIFYGLSEPEVVDFRTVSFIIEKNFQKIFWVGLIFKDGERFFPREGFRNNRLDTGEREYSDYNSIGISYNSVLLNIIKRSDVTKLYINTNGSVSYIHFNGFKQLGNPDKNKFKEENLKSILLEGGIKFTFSRNLFHRVWVTAYYDPFSLKIGAFGFGAGHTTFGLKVSI